jgi:hypothetical protein
MNETATKLQEKIQQMEDEKEGITKKQDGLQ